MKLFYPIYDRLLGKETKEKKKSVRETLRSRAIKTTEQRETPHNTGREGEKQWEASQNTTRTGKRKTLNQQQQHEKKRKKEGFKKLKSRNTYTNSIAN